MDFFILKVRNKFALNVANKQVKKIYTFLNLFLVFYLNMLENLSKLITFSSVKQLRVLKSQH